MAKRVIQECDLTKQEYDPDETVTIVIKKKGKSTGRTYELSPTAAAKLEQQLVAGKEAILEDGWGFSSQSYDNNSKSTKKITLADLEHEIQEEEQPEVQQESFYTEESLDSRIEQKKQELHNSQEATTNLVTTGETTNNDLKKCIHLNKGRIQTTFKDGKRFVYRLCTGCHKRIEEKTASEKRAVHDKVPDGFRITERDKL